MTKKVLLIPLVHKNYISLLKPTRIKGGDVEAARLTKLGMKLGKNRTVSLFLSFGAVATELPLDTFRDTQIARLV